MPITIIVGVAIEMIISHAAAIVSKVAARIFWRQICIGFFLFLFLFTDFGGPRDYNNRREGFMTRDRPDNNRFEPRVNDV